MSELDELTLCIKSLTLHEFAGYDSGLRQLRHLPCFSQLLRILRNCDVL